MSKNICGHCCAVFDDDEIAVCEADPDTVKRSPVVEYGAKRSEPRGIFNPDNFRNFERIMREMKGDLEK